LPALAVILYVMILVLVAVTQPNLALGGGALLATLVVAGVIWSKVKTSNVGKGAG
jgi:hypothetical protein